MKVSRRRLLGVAVVLPATLAAGAWWFRPWTPVMDQTIGQATPLSAMSAPPAGPTPDVPSPPDEARLLYSTRTWKSYRHRTGGIVEIYRLPGGRRILRLAGFATSSGHDMVVWLSPRPYTDGRFVGTGSVSLGTLKDERGNFNYAIPDGTDLGKYASVVIWCRRLTVPFGAAPVHL